MNRDHVPEWAHLESPQAQSAPACPASRKVSFCVAGEANACFFAERFCKKKALRRTVALGSPHPAAQCGLASAGMDQ
jgi:hypothetical protein